MFLSYSSTPVIVMYYLIRKYPQYLCRLQNDAMGGPSDNIFMDVSLTWHNISQNLSDNMELIPEFF